MIDYTYTAHESYEEALDQLRTIIAHLRSENGCPWDREQTGEDITLNLIDEAYEYLDALRSGSAPDMIEELGDVFLNVLMLGHIQEESDETFVIEALNTVSEKLIRRHPHVFSSASAHSPDDVLVLWDRMKAKEGKGAADDDFFSRIPSTLPIFEKAVEIQRKMRKVGFDWPDSSGVFEKVQEEMEEVRESLEEGGDTEEELGDLLFSVINLTRFLGYDPSYALRRTNEKVRGRFNRVVARAKEEGLDLKAASLDQLEAFWQRAKDEA
ncbi:MAG: nucleoside triphosphate pyrophosphohydrolase [Spirochaetales bacterium]|nr:nucleoside triphosphate pyrophosphohydrolase [Spirochaetales bacterium]